VVLGLIGLWALVAAIGLVRNFWHYATDTIGAMFLAVVVVVGLALLIDRSRISSPGARSLASTARAA
jgi:uncharacterized membrane protein